MLTAEKLTELCDSTIKQCNALFDRLLLSTEPFALWIEADELINTAEPCCDFPQHVSPDAELRKASTEASKRFSDFAIDTMVCVDLYEKLKSQTIADPETSRFHQRVLRNFERNGLALEEEKRSLLSSKKKQLASLCTDAVAAISSDSSSLLFDQEQLVGMPQSFLDKVKNGSQYEIKAIYPHMFPVLDQCQVESTRQAVERLLENRAPTNSVRAKEIVKLRHEIAQLLGYANYAEYALEFRMAKTPDRVQQMFDSLLPMMESKADLERQHLEQLGSVVSYNVRYLQDQRLQSFQVDHAEIQKYFPLEHIVQETLALYQELFGLTFTRLEEPAWHPDVQTFQVSEGSKIWGTFYLDLLPRENKYGHAAVFPLRCGTPNQTAMAAMVCNFSDTLKHSEFVTLFHEFGHVMHNLLGQTKFSSTSGTNVEKDFVELPSQMLENYCWDKRVLQRISKGPDGPLPDSLVDPLIKCRNANNGLFYLRQAFYGLADQVVHKSADDPQVVFTELKPKICGYACPTDTCSLANFWHFFGGYEASYYGYLWSDIYSADLFQALGDCLDPIQVQRYRKAILEKGGSCDAADMLKDFLGRDPTVDAFIKRLAK